METRLSKKRKLESGEEITLSTSLFDLPMEMLLYLGQFLELEYIFKFRCYSRYSREVGNAMLSHRRELTITSRSPRNRMQIRVILKQCHSLRMIDIALYGDETILTDKIIQNLLSNNPLLEEAEVWINSSTGITSKALIPLSTKCKNLEKLSIQGLKPGNGFLRTLSAHNNHLVDVEFNFDLPSDCWETIWKFLKKQPKLQRITLPDMFTLCLEGFSIDEINENTHFAIAEFCKELTYLGNFKGKIHELRKIVDNCPKLKTIEFAYNERISKEILSYLRSKSIEVDGGDGGCPESDLDSDLDDELYWSYESNDEFSDDFPPL